MSGSEAFNVEGLMFAIFFTPLYMFVKAGGLYSRARGRERSLLAAHYGRPVALLLIYLWPNASEQYGRVHNHVLRGTHEELQAFKQGVTDECQMTAIGGAILAQVGITALNLNFINNVHWVAKAAFVISVSSGCLSVYYACSVQRLMGKLFNVKMVKTWLTTTPIEDVTGGFFNSPVDQEVASLSAILTISAPFGLLTISIFAFLMGFLIYHGFLFSYQLDPEAGRYDNRNVFICLMIATGICFLMFYISLSTKGIESLVVLHGSPIQRTTNGVGSSMPANNNPDIELEETHTSIPARRRHESDLANALKVASTAHAEAAAASKSVAEILQLLSASPIASHTDHQ